MCQVCQIETHIQKVLPCETTFLECPCFPEDEVEKQIYFSEILCDSLNSDPWRRKRINTIISSQNSPNYVKACFFNDFIGIFFLKLSLIKFGNGKLWVYACIVFLHTCVHMNIYILYIHLCTMLNEYRKKICASSYTWQRIVIFNVLKKKMITCEMGILNYSKGYSTCVQSWFQPATSPCFGMG